MRVVSLKVFDLHVLPSLSGPITCISPKLQPSSCLAPFPWHAFSSTYNTAWPPVLHSLHISTPLNILPCHISATYMHPADNDNASQQFRDDVPHPPTFPFGTAEAYQNADTSTGLQCRPRYHAKVMSIKQNGIYVVKLILSA
jgi:hypothetical protein